MKKAILAAAILPLMTLSLQAQELFQVSAKTTDGSNITQTLGGSSLKDLIQNAIDSKDQFQVFKDKASTASVTYGGVKDAINLSKSADNKSVTVNIPSAHFSKTFTGTSDEMSQQVQDFLKKDGSTTVMKLLKEVNAKSAVAVTDGNPNSATAKVSLSTFRSYGTMSAPQCVERVNPSEYLLMADIGSFSAGDYKGTTYFVPITMDIRLCSRVRLGLEMPLSYTVINDAKVFDAGLALSLPIRLINPSEPCPEVKKDAKPEEPQRWTWQITPTGGAVAAGSIEFLAGGVLAYGALTNMVAYNFDYFTLSVGNQITFFNGVPLSFGEYKISTGSSQELLKNGLQVSVPLTSRCLVNVYATYSNFIEAASVPDWVTVGIDGGVRLFSAHSAMFKVGYYADLGKDYTANVGRVGFAWRF